MRFVGIVAIVGIACAPIVPAPEPQVVPGMTNDELDARLVGLRATLTRSQIALDDAPQIESCKTAHLGSRCVRCNVARRDNTVGIEPSLIDSAAIAFATYPPKLLAATGVRHVALCRSIEVPDGELPAAGIALLDQQRILVNVGSFEHAAEGFTIDRVIHHELFHLLDYHGGTFHDDREWSALNPAGFAYEDPEMHYRDRDLMAARPAGFVRAYATQNEAEDRASTFDLLFARPAELCAIAAADRIVANKVALIKRRVQKVAGKTPLWAPCAKPTPPRPTREPIDLRIRER